MFAYVFRVHDRGKMYRTPTIVAVPHLLFRTQDSRASFVHTFTRSPPCTIIGCTLYSVPLRSCSMLPCPCVRSRARFHTAKLTHCARSACTIAYTWYVVTEHAAFVPYVAPRVICIFFVDSRFYKTTDGAELPQSVANHLSERAVDFTVDIVYNCLFLNRESSVVNVVVHRKS